MRFKLTINAKTPAIIPINYQYELSSWIYKIINNSSSEFSEWLHNVGFTDGKRNFKLFTFSQLNIPVYKISKADERLIINWNEISLIISFLMPEAAEKFILGLFQQQAFTLGDHISKADFQIKSIEKLPEPEWKECMYFKTISPILVSKMQVINEKASAIYLSPKDEAYEDLIFQNLIRKYAAGAIPLNLAPLAKEGFTTETKIEILSEPKAKLITIKTNTPQQTKIKAYQFQFKITAPIELLKVAYFSGIGEKNSLGCGSIS
jgi:CRISPR-associated endoribonuclease Cas6